MIKNSKPNSLNDWEIEELRLESLKKAVIDFEKSNSKLPIKESEIIEEFSGPLEVLHTRKKHVRLIDLIKSYEYHPVVFPSLIKKHLCRADSFFANMVFAKGHWWIINMDIPYGCVKWDERQPHSPHHSYF